MILAVLTFPGHYAVAQLSILHAIKHIPNITDIAIIWDDTSGVEPQDDLAFIMRIHHKLEDYNIFTVRWSNIIPQFEADEVWGAVGQQLIKLHLDLGFGFKDCIIMDGDTILRTDVDPEHILYSSRMCTKHTRYDFINHALGIPNYEFWTNTFMYVKSVWLNGLRQHVETATGGPLYKQFEYIDRNIPVFEWQLIAIYILRILKINKNIEYFYKFVLPVQKFEEYYDTEFNIVLDGRDDFSDEFIVKHNLVRFKARDD